MSAGLRRDAGRWAIGLHGLELRSVFQPVYSLSHGRPVGHEALVRAFDASGASVAPQHALRGNGSFDDLLLGDRAARMIHAFNFAELVGDDPHWLFFNMQTQVFVALKQVQSDGFQRTLQALRVELDPPAVISQPPRRFAELDHGRFQRLQDFLQARIDGRRFP